MHNLFVSTIGTSLLVNTARLANILLREDLYQYANKQIHEATESQKSEISLLRNEAQMLIERTSGDERLKLSAEIHAYLRFVQEQEQQNPEHHILICSDTLQGQVTGELFEGFLRKRGHSVFLYSVPGLHTGDILSFRDGLTRLAKYCVEEIPMWRQKKARVIFNLNGGFKSVQGFMQSLANILADETIYVFEGRKSSLLRVPRLPIRLDPDQQITKNLTLFRRLYSGYDAPVPQAKDLPETLFLQVDERIILSEWGTTIFGAMKYDIYSKKLLPELNDRLVISPHFAESVRGLSPDRMVHINKTLDDLAICLDPRFGSNPKSLSFKKIKGKLSRYPTETHEAYAWSDDDAKRIYGRFVDEKFVLYTLGEHSK